MEQEMEDKRRQREEVMVGEEKSIFLGGISTFYKS